MGAISYDDLLDNGLMEDVESLRAQDAYETYMQAGDDPQEQARRQRTEQCRNYRERHRNRVNELKRANYRKHREEINRRRREKRALMKTNDPEKYAETVAKQMVYDAAHKEQISARNREHYREHREETIRRTVEYNRLNPDKRAQYQRTYRARKKAEALQQERKELRPNA